MMKRTAKAERTLFFSALTGVTVVTYALIALVKLLAGR